MRSHWASKPDKALEGSLTEEDDESTHAFVTNKTELIQRYFFASSHSHTHTLTHASDEVCQHARKKHERNFHETSVAYSN